MACSQSSDMLSPNNELCDNMLKQNEAANPALNEVHRQESGIFEGSSDFSDNYFSDNDIEWHSDDEEDEGVIAPEENNDNLWEEFQQCTFWSPPCSIKLSRCCTSTDSQVEGEEMPMVKLSSAGSHKRVTFKPDRELVTVHNIIAWEYAYRACRRGPWEQMAQDRMRFARRVEEVSMILEPCLKKLTNQMSSSD